MTTYIYAYCRQPCNPDRQVEDQVSMVDDYRRKRRFPGSRWAGGAHIDWSSERGVLVFERPATLDLNERLRKGDQLIVPDTGLAFGTLRDFAICVKLWHEWGVVLHLLDLGIDGRTRSGVEALGLIRRMAEAQAVRRSEITIEAHAKNVARRRPVNQKAPYGFRWGGRRGNRHLQVDREQQRILRVIARLRDEEGKTFAAISDEIERDLAARVGREFKKSAFYERTWPALRCRRAYAALKKSCEERISE